MISENKNMAENEIGGKMYLMDKLLDCKRLKMKKSTIHGDWLDLLEKDSICSKRTYKKDSLYKKNYLIGSGDLSGDKVNDNFSNSSIVKESGVLISKKRRQIKQWDLVFPNQNVKKQIATKNLNKIKLRPTNVYHASEFCESDKNSKSLMVCNKQQKEQQIKDVYLENTLKGIKKAPSNFNSHKASSFVNRKMKHLETKRINNIIVNKILNVQSTIPKARK